MFPKASVGAHSLPLMHTNDGAAVVLALALFGDNKVLKEVKVQAAVVSGSCKSLLQMRMPITIIAIETVEIVRFPIKPTNIC